MNNYTKLITPCRIVVSVVQRSVFNSIPGKICCKHSTTVAYNFKYFGARTMSQKSITSFFKITPKKAAEIKVEEQEQAESPASSPVKNGNKVDSSPVTNGKEKRSSKRQRLDSSDSDSQPAASSKPSSPVDSDKKKKIKRQRIESSGSEAESPKLEEDEAKIKFEPACSPKTYDSPKSKKSKAKVQKSPESPKSESKAKGKSLVEKNDKTASPTAKKKMAVKKEKSPEVKKEKEVKEVKNFFLKQESTEVKPEDNGDGGTVPEEEYDPGKGGYCPVRDACWARGAGVPYLALARTLALVEATSARTRMVQVLAQYLRSVVALSPEDLLPSLYLCLNRLAPAYHNLELGIAETYLMKAVGQSTGRSVAQVRAAARREGDLGAAAEKARATQTTMRQPAKLTVRGVFGALTDIARMTGQASVNKKIAKIQTLFIACRQSEAKFLIRSLEGKLRIGLAEQSLLAALALAVAHTPPPVPVRRLDASEGVAPERFKAHVEAVSLAIKTTYCECPNYEAIAGALLRHGWEALPSHCRLRPGVPLKPMLAQPTKGLHEIFDRFEKEKFTCEYKYDGERAQIHVPSLPDEAGPDWERAGVFSRNQEDHTSKYPDVLRRLPSLLGPEVSSCVIDAEAVAYDVVEKRILPFQVLSTRKRKAVEEQEIKVQVCVFAFDLLFLNGRPLVREPLAERRRLLRENFREVEGQWQFARAADCSTLEEVQLALEEALRGCCEGLMVKLLEGDHARYDIARRSHNWLKLKKDYLEGVGDSLDLVVLGAYEGKGRRKGVFGGFLLGCYDHEQEEFQATCKLGTGFSDDQLRALSDQIKEHVIDQPRSYYRVDPSHWPDAWVGAALVWEVRCADLSLSPAHRAAMGLVAPDKGISLRFPRFVRERPDKAAEQATTARQVAALYLAQEQVRGQPKGDPADDFY